MSPSALRKAVVATKPFSEKPDVESGSRAKRYSTLASELECWSSSEGVLMYSDGGQRVL